MPFGAKSSCSNNEDEVITPKSGVIDTSFLVEELRKKFHCNGEYVDVDFRRLVSWVRVGDQLSHQIHPYPAKLLPNIAHFFTRASILQHEQHRVLDPFCGSGTVALEASLAGHIPYVADANPLALLITRVKTTAYDPEAILQDLKRILLIAKRLRNAPEIPVVNQHLWYSKDKKKSLEILLRAILETTRENMHKDFFLVAFSVISRRLSWADPAISVPVKLKTKDSFSEKQNDNIKSRLDWISNADTLAEYFKACKANIERIRECNYVRPNRVTAVPVGSDARTLKSPVFGEDTPLKAESIPLIITSPPYGSAQKYIRATSLSLNWLGMADPNGLSALEGKSIGREHLPLHRQQEIKHHLPDQYEELLLRIKKKNELRARITHQYLHEMKTALSEMARVTAQNGHVVIVVGNNMVCGEALRNDQFMVDVMRAEGLSLDIGLIDHIKSRGLMTKRNKTASVISRESVLVFKK